MLRSVLFAAIALLPSTAMAEARPATEAEFSKLVQGCWLSTTLSFEEQVQQSDLGYGCQKACFGEDDTVETQWLAGHPDWGMEGFGEKGRYALQNDKLVLDGPLADGWIFGPPHVECDAEILPDVLLRLTNCIGIDRVSGNPARAAERVDDLTLYSARKAGPNAQC